MTATRLIRGVVPAALVALAMGRQAGAHHAGLFHMWGCEDGRGFEEFTGHRPEQALASDGAFPQ